MNTYDDLRGALKRMDNALAYMYDVAKEHGTEEAHALRKLYEGFDDLCEYMLKHHARLERLNTEVAMLKRERTDVG